MSYLEKQLQRLSFIFAFCWLASLMFSPSCRPTTFITELAGAAIAFMFIAPVVLLLLIRNQHALVNGASIHLKSHFSRNLVFGLMCLGVVGCLSSTGCAQLEAFWPTIDRSNPWLMDAPSLWKTAGQGFMVLGAIGLFITSFKLKKSVAKP